MHNALNPSYNILGMVDIKDVISCDKLPSPPGAAIRVMRLARQSEPDIRQLIEAIKADPMLTGKVLSTINSSLFALPKKVTSIDQAVVLLGSHTVSSLITALCLGNRTTRGSDAEYFDRFWKSAILAAASCEVIATQFNRGIPATLFTAGLLMDIGALALLTSQPALYKPLIDAARTGQGDLCELEQTQFGFTHVEVSMGILRRWRVPQEIQNATELHHSDPTQWDDRVTPKTRMVAGALVVASHIGDFACNQDRLTAWAKLRHSGSLILGLQPSGMIRLFEQIDDQIQDTAKLLGYATDLPKLNEIVRDAGISDSQTHERLEEAQSTQPVLFGRGSNSNVTPPGAVTDITRGAESFVNTQPVTIESAQPSSPYTDEEQEWWDEAVTDASSEQGARTQASGVPADRTQPVAPPVASPATPPGYIQNVSAGTRAADPGADTTQPVLLGQTQRVAMGGATQRVAIVPPAETMSPPDASMTGAMPAVFGPTTSNLSVLQRSGIYPIEFFLESLRREFRRCCRYSEDLGVVLVEITATQALDPRIVSAIGLLVKEIVRDCDIVGRLEGQRYGLVITRPRENGLGVIAERMTSGIDKLLIDQLGVDHQYVSVSIGAIVAWPSGNEAHAEMRLLRQAQEALQAAVVSAQRCSVVVRRARGA